MLFDLLSRLQLVLAKDLVHEMILVVSGGVADDHGSLASRRAKSKFGGQTSHDRPVGSMRGDPSKRKKIAHKPHVDQRSHGVDSGGFADGEEGNILLYPLLLL